MPVRTKLSLPASTVLDSNGNGQILASPDSGSTSWEVTRISVRTNQALTQGPFPQAELFDSITPVQSASYGATYVGHNDVFDTSGDPLEIGPNDAILIVWTGGIPGTTASAIIRGHKILARGLWGGEAQGSSWDCWRYSIARVVRFRSRRLTGRLS